MEEDDDYFNEVLFDDAVLSVVHPLLILERVFKQDVQRDDEVGDTKKFSELTGVHTLSWAPGAKKKHTDRFNANAMKIRQAFRSLSSKVDAAKMSKEKTRPLQFLAPAELLERCVCFLLFKDGEHNHNLTPEEVVAKLAKVKIDEELSNFEPTKI